MLTNSVKIVESNFHTISRYGIVLLDLSGGTVRVSKSSFNSVKVGVFSPIELIKGYKTVGDDYTYEGLLDPLKILCKDVLASMVYPSENSCSHINRNLKKEKVRIVSGANQMKLDQNSFYLCSSEIELKNSSLQTFIE